MKNTVVFSCGVAACMLIWSVTMLVPRFPASAQRTSGNAWEYAAITGSYGASPTENPNVSFTSAVNICYLENSGCRNEEVRAGVPYARFLQDNRLDNNAKSMELARHRAVENAYSKAFAKLGSEGWEMIDKPDLQFDTFFQNASGTFDVLEGNRDRKADIYFKRPR
jgi:hypothetical protein